MYGTKFMIFTLRVLPPISTHDILRNWCQLCSIHLKYVWFSLREELGFMHDYNTSMIIKIIHRSLCYTWPIEGIDCIQEHRSLIVLHLFLYVSTGTLMAILYDGKNNNNFQFYIVWFNCKIMIIVPYLTYQSFIYYYYY